MSRDLAAAPSLPSSPVAEPVGDVVGWGGKARWSDPGAFTASTLVARTLAELGVTHAFGVLGGGIAAFADGLRRAPIRLVHTRHEAGAGFAAIEAHFATGRPTAVVVTTGPGLWNALNPAMAARADGAKLVIISGATSRAQLGRGAVQETGPGTASAALTTAGALFHLAAQPESEGELGHFLQQLACGWSRPGGFVAHLALPWSVQTALCDAATAPRIAPWSVTAAAPGIEALDATLARLGRGRAAIWIGHGCRAAAAELRAFAEAAQLPVLSSPRAKGVFPEDHPLFVGVSGAGGHASVPALFAEHRPDAILVLGTRLGEVTSFLTPSATPSHGWIHVDLDATAFAAAFPGVPGLGVVADCRAFLAALDARARATGWYLGRRAPAFPAVAAPPALAPRPGDVRPAFLMQVVQEHIVDGTDAIVMSEAGNSFTWCNYALRFRTPDRYRTSAAWGSMGHFTTGGVGAALASGRRAVAVVGDGAMLMNNEISTAVQYRAKVVWVILNDAQLGLNQHGMAALGMRPVETQLPRTDFVGYARSLGADGEAVLTEAALDAALDRATAFDGPYVLDVRIDRSIPSPVIADRIKTLERQAAGAST